MAHNAVAASNRARIDELRAHADVNIRLLTPAWWFEEGRRIDVSGSGSASWRVGRTLLTGNSTRYVYLSGLLDALRHFRPDVVDLYEEPFSLVALQTVLLRDLCAPNAALVFYSAVNVRRQWRWPYRAIERLVLRRADAAHAPSQDVPRILAAKGFAGPVAVIPLGVDQRRFADARPTDLPAIPKPRVGFVGRFEPVKGLDVLVDAVERLSMPVSLVMAGDGSERARLAGRPGLHMLPPVSYAALPGFLKSLDVLVLPSVTILPLHREQFGRVLVEAMAAGVPVIGSSSGAIPEVIGDAGLVVPERDSAALANAIQRILSESALRQALRERGQQRVNDSFRWPVVAEQTLDLFRTALTRRRRALRHLQAVGA